MYYNGNDKITYPFVASRQKKKAMSLPSSEPLPDDINDLPPARQRHIRRLPSSATQAERQILLDSLVEQTSPTLNFFLLTLIGVLAVGSALYFNEPALLIVSILTLPLIKPIFGLGLLPMRLKLSSGFKALISLLIPMLLTLVSGCLAGWLQKTGSLDHLSVNRFGEPYWLDLVIVSASALLGALILLRQGRLPSLVGALLSYEILIPLAAAGFGFILGDVLLWPGALLTSFLHLGTAVFSAMFAFFLLGFLPKKAPGWLMTLIPLALIAAGLIMGMHVGAQGTLVETESSPTPTFILIPSQSPSPKLSGSFTTTSMPAIPTQTPTPSQSPTVTLTLTQTSTLTQTHTPEPTTYWGVIDSLTGAVVRESPDFTATVITYVNDGNQIEILNEALGEGGTRWFKVRTETGLVGWLLSSLVNTPTTTATP